MPISVSTIPFLCHILIETPAALTFILRPSSHVSPLPPSAGLLLQSLGGLLLASNLIALIFVRRPLDDVARHVALALAFWHMWPCYRAVVRLSRRADGEIRSGEEAATGKTLGGPAVHLLIHSVLLVMFLGTWMLGDV
ncbi:hypothetical protein BGZ61DRAFT_529660 [Ilyonectria robusta]|uniref:uncharacterized protein n=1 Tax=Ilyonectria robusta TaxID=1079257 RepID=UPI001E8CC686|nr:uncharacterized protein BGZ61DRAFT_529660 [Ilyonectria robusta]KAH8729458.1 hypothetical protein BGZ61DRAFT_529660 [Ilyonectria robusta]